jgi:hypothetical protein
VAAAIDGKSILSPGLPIDEIEKAYQTGLRELMGLSSFIDVLLVLHYAVFFSEERPGALWDINAQRQLLRALFLPGSVAAQIAEAERKVAGADNYARQVQFVLSRHRNSLNSMLQAQAAAPALLAKLKPQQTLLEASLNRRSALDEGRETISSDMEATRLDYERAKIGPEDAERAVERLKFETLSRMFPKLPDVARLTLLTLLSKSECLVCGAHAETARAAIEAELREGSCPVCHSPPEQQENIVSVQQVEGSRLARARERAELAATEESAQKDKLEKITGEYEAILVALKAISTEIAEIERSVRVLSAQLPAPTEEVKRLQLTVDDLTKSLTAANSRRAEFAEELRAAFVPAQAAAEEQSEVLVRAFEHHARALLDEEATLVRDTARPAIAQQAAQFPVPAFYADMASAARPGLIRRRSQTDVSESQRELVDLAFRFALIEAAGGSRTSTLVMETPEASLDQIAMERVGKALSSFAAEGASRLIVTSNLTNEGIIPWLFGGRTTDEAEVTARRERTINLLSISAKNRALLNDTEGRYQQLLTKALRG